MQTSPAVTCWQLLPLSVYAQAGVLLVAAPALLAMQPHKLQQLQCLAQTHPPHTLRFLSCSVCNCFHPPFVQAGVLLVAAPALLAMQPHTLQQLQCLAQTHPPHTLEWLSCPVCHCFVPSVCAGWCALSSCPSTAGNAAAYPAAQAAAAAVPGSDTPQLARGLQELPVKVLSSTADVLAGTAAAPALRSSSPPAAHVSVWVVAPPLSPPIVSSLG